MAGRCFVIMGFGKKTDYSGTPRTLDLDRSYEAIIKPAVTSCGLECIRADEISHSGLIDKPMYELLLRADLVIADISTANPNALYELGVRHALRPFRTIVIKEIDGKFMFDLNHLATFQYKHLGEDIGSKEAQVRSAELALLIKAVMQKQDNDSPVHQFLQLPVGDAKIDPEAARAERIVRDAQARAESLSNAIEAGRKAMAASEPAEAQTHFRHAYELQTEAPQIAPSGAASKATADPYVVQQLALATYKAAAEDPVPALTAARKIIEELAPATSTDPETLGITGAIHKRLWETQRRREDLDAAIEYYGRGFELKRDYYTGENYAICLDWRAAEQADAAEATYDRTSARKVRERIVRSLAAAFKDRTTAERTDYEWMLASMANTLRALGDAKADHWEQQFLALPELATWKRQSFEKGKAAALAVAARDQPPV